MQTPSSFIGAGVLLNVLFPDWLLTFLLTALLLWLTVRIGRKAARLYKVQNMRLSYLCRTSSISTCCWRRSSSCLH